MKLYIGKVLFCVTMFIHAEVLYAQEKISKMNAGGNVSIVFTDTDIFRRTLDSAPAIGEGNEDCSVKIGCMGRADCLARIRLIYDLISTKKNFVSSCKTPIYARVTITPDLGYGESEEKEAEIYDIDYTGTCVNHRNSSYEIKKSIFGILNTKPIKDWSKGGK